MLFSGLLFDAPRLRTESIAKNSFDYVIELKSKMIYTVFGLIAV